MTVSSHIGEDELRDRVAGMQERLLRYSVDYRSLFNDEHTTGTLLALEARQLIGALNSELLSRRSAGLGTVSVTDAAEFSIARLDDFERGSLSDDIEDACRDFDGHVSPAIERLREALSCLTSIGVEAGK